MRIGCVQRAVPECSMRTSRVKPAYCTVPVQCQYQCQYCTSRALDELQKPGGVTSLRAETREG